MSLKKVKSVKDDKGFKIWDILVYGLVVALIAALFTVIFFTSDTSPLTGIRIYTTGAAVFEYNFEKSEYKQLSENVTFEITDSDGILTVKISDGDGFNTVRIDKSGKVKVVDADCHNKDCMYLPEITNNSKSIICIPHGLRIVPYGFEEDDGNIII